MDTPRIDAFREHFGIAAPAALFDLYRNEFLRDTAPVEFRFKHDPAVLQIQYWLDIADAANYDVARKRVAFAVTTDGFTILADLSRADLNIIQDEFGDFDCIGFAIHDILSAERWPNP